MSSLDSIKKLYNASELYNITLNRIVLAEDDPEKISVARQSFAKISNDEMPLLMYDNTATCNGEQGFLLTNKNLYVGNNYETPVSIDLQSITSVEAKPKLISSVIIVNDIKIDASGLLKKDLLKVGDFLQKVIPLAMQIEKAKEKPVEVPKEKVAEVSVEQKKVEVQKDNAVAVAEKNSPKAEEKPEIKIEGDFDALLAKWKDIFTRDIKWVCQQAPESDEILYDGTKAKTFRYVAEDKSLTFISRSREVITAERYKSSREEVDGYFYILTYKPDSSEKFLALSWYLARKSRAFASRNTYTITTEFHSESGEKKGQASITVKAAYMKPQFESIFVLLGQLKDESANFINKLKLADKEFFDKQKEFIDMQNRKTDDDFDSL